MNNNDMAECAICYSLQPCIGIDDGSDLICADRRACQQRNAENLAPEQPSLAQWIENAENGASIDYLIEHDRATFCAILEGSHDLTRRKLASAYLMARGVESQSRAALIPGVLFVWAGYVKERNANA